MINTSPLNQALADSIIKATGLTGNLIDFTKIQLPDVIHQFLMWKFVESGLDFIIGILCFPLMFYFFKKSNGGDHEGYSLLSVICFVLVILFVPFNWDWLQIIIAPKVYLIEHTKDLLPQ